MNFARKNRNRRSKFKDFNNYQLKQCSKWYHSFSYPFKLSLCFLLLASSSLLVIAFINFIANTKQREHQYPSFFSSSSSSDATHTTSAHSSTSNDLKTYIKNDDLLRANEEADDINLHNHQKSYKSFSSSSSFFSSSTHMGNSGSSHTKTDGDGDDDDTDLVSVDDHEVQHDYDSDDDTSKERMGDLNFHGDAEEIEIKNSVKDIGGSKDKNKNVKRQDGISDGKDGEGEQQHKPQRQTEVGVNAGAETSYNDDHHDDDNDGCLFLEGEDMYQYVLRTKNKQVTSQIPYIEDSGTYQPPCESVLLFQDKKFNGLGSQIIRMLFAYAYAKHFRMTFVIAAGKYWNYGCHRNYGWNCYFSDPVQSCRYSDGTVLNVTEQSFQNLTSCLELALLDTPKDHSRTGCWLDTSDDSDRYIHDVLTSLDGDLTLTVSKLLREFLLLKPYMKPPLAKLLLSTGLYLNTSKSKSWIGVHIRRGDKTTETPPVPISLYASTLRFVNKNSLPVFVASDDFQAVTELKQALPEYEIVTIVGVKRQGHDQLVHNQMTRQERSQHVIETLAEIRLLAKSKVFICTFSSNFGKLVFQLRDWTSPESTISLDSGWEPGVAWRNFNISYCDGLFANHRFCASPLAALVKRQKALG